MESRQKFTTLDLYLSSFISLQGIEPNLEIKGNKVAFSFEPTDRLYRIMADFNSNAEVPVADYATILKTLKGKMLSLKEGIAGNGNWRKHGNESFR